MNKKSPDLPGFVLYRTAIFLSFMLMISPSIA